MIKYNLNLQELTSTERSIIKFVYSWKEDYPPNASDVAKGLNLPHSTVSTALKRMVSSPHRKRTIFKWIPRHSIKITDFGKKVAEHIAQHHHVFELFLHKFLGLPKDDAHNESEEIGFNISCVVTIALIKKLEIKSWTEDCVCPETFHSCGPEIDSS